MRRCVALSVCVLVICAPPGDSLKIFQKVKEYFSPATTTTLSPMTPVVPEYEKGEGDSVIPWGEEATEELYGSTTATSEWTSTNSADNYDHGVSGQREYVGHQGTASTTRNPKESTGYGVDRLSTTEQNSVNLFGQITTPKSLIIDGIGRLSTTEKGFVNPYDQIATPKRPIANSIGTLSTTERSFVNPYDQLPTPNRPITNSIDGFFTTQRQSVYPNLEVPTTQRNYGYQYSGMSTATVQNSPSQRPSGADAGQIVFMDSSEMDHLAGGDVVPESTPFVASTTMKSDKGAPVNDGDGRVIVNAPVKECEPGKKLDANGKCRKVSRK